MLVPPAAATAYPQNALFCCICTTKWCHPCDASGAVSVVRFAQQHLTWCASMECPVMPDSGTTLPVLLSPRSSALPYFHAHTPTCNRTSTTPAMMLAMRCPAMRCPAIGGGGARWSAQRYSGAREACCSPCPRRVKAFPIRQRPTRGHPTPQRGDAICLKEIAPNAVTSEMMPVGLPAM